MRGSHFQPRFLQALGYASLITVALFWAMHLLIQGGRHAFEKSETLQTIDFVRLKKDTELETRTRQKPPKPPPPKEPPPPPRMKVETVSPQNAPTPFALPKLDLRANLGIGPFLGGYVGDPSGYSELIPLVRIAPQYPRNALRDGIEGYVVLRVVVRPDGTVREAVPVEAQPRGVFEAAAVNTILKWKFKAKLVDGKPVEQVALQKLEFKLEARQ